MTSSKKSLNYAQIWYTVVFEVAVHDLAIEVGDQDFVIGLSKFKMAEQM